MSEPVVQIFRPDDEQRVTVEMEIQRGLTVEDSQLDISRLKVRVAALEAEVAWRDKRIRELEAQLEQAAP